MKFYCLSADPNKPCNVVKFWNTYIMLDCSLEVVSTLCYLPLSIIHNQQISAMLPWRTPRDKISKELNFNYRDLRSLEFELKESTSGHVFVDSSPEFGLPKLDLVNIEQIDVILISNYLCMFALPYLTERLNFDGNIYVTEPTFHFGKIMMEEMIKLIERVPRPKKAKLWKNIHQLIPLPYPKSHACERTPARWEQIYSSKELNSCLSKLKVVSFSQSVDIFGSFEISAHSSGYCIGSCNWVMKSDHEKIVYMSQTSTLLTHSRQFEPSALQNPDVMIVTNLTAAPMANPDTMLKDLCTNTIQTLNKGGNVLIPCHPCGVIYDLLEYLSGQLNHSGLLSVPIYFLSPVADSSLAYANILGEWLATQRQSRVFIPEEPFAHSNLVRINRLKHYPSVNDPTFNEEFRTPCILFTNHPSLRFGDVVHFIQLWGNSSKNLLLMIEPDYPCHEATLPYQPLQMRVMFCPIDTNWNFVQATKCIKDLKPLHLLTPERYAMKQQIPGLSFNDLIVDLKTEGGETSEDGQKQLVSANSVDSTNRSKLTLTTFSYGETVCLSQIKRSFERIHIDFSLAANVIQSEIAPGITFATINGSLHAKDNKYTLYPLADNNKRQKLALSNSSTPSDHFFGTLDFPALVNKLAQHGINDAMVEGARSGRIVQLRSKQALIHVEDSQTHIICVDSVVRRQIREIVSSCLRKF